MVLPAWCRNIMDVMVVRDSLSNGFMKCICEPAGIELDGEGPMMKDPEKGRPLEWNDITLDVYRI
jgi:hypothetical protein